MSNTLTSIPKRIATAPAVATAITNVKKADAAFQSKLDELAQLLHPEAYIASLETLIRSESDVAAIQEFQREIASVNANKDLSRETAISLTRPAQGELYASLATLLTTALAELEILALEAKTSEAAMLAEYALPWESTAVTRRVNSHKAQLQSKLDSFQPDVNRAGNIQLARSASASILAWFA